MRFEQTNDKKVRYSIFNARSKYLPMRICICRRFWFCHIIRAFIFRLSSFFGNFGSFLFALQSKFHTNKIHNSIVAAFDLVRYYDFILHIGLYQSSRVWQRRQEEVGSIREQRTVWKVIKKWDKLKDRNKTVCVSVRVNMWNLDIFVLETVIKIDNANHSEFLDITNMLRYYSA